MIINCSSSTASHLIHSNLLNCDVPTRRSVGQLYLRTSAPRRLGQLCLRTTASRRGCISPYFTADGVMIINIGSVLGEIISEMKTEVSTMKKSIGAVPGIGVIQVGDTKVLPLYPLGYSMLGMKRFVVSLAEDSSEEEVLKSVSCFNDDRSVHGILVQLPLPSHIDEQKILNAVSIEKDMDGVNPQNIARLAMQNIEPLCVPPAPKACIELIRRYNLETNGKRAVVLGSSYRFSMPAALLLERDGATVTIIHSKTKNPEEITRQADIIISDVWEQNNVRESWIKPGAVVIDLVSRTPRTWYEIYDVASAITYGNYYGLLITMMSLSNVLASAKRSHNFI